jgi:hypothetical protein
MDEYTAQTVDLTAQLHTLPTSHPDQAFIRRYLGTPRPVLGVRADDLRKLAKAYGQARTPTAPAAQWLELLDQPLHRRHLRAAQPGRAAAGRAAPAAPKAGTGAAAHMAGRAAGLGGSGHRPASRVGRMQRGAGALGRMGPVPGKSQPGRQRQPAPRQPGAAGDAAAPQAPTRGSRQRALANVQRLQHERDGMITKAVSWVLRSMIADATGHGARVSGNQCRCATSDRRARGAQEVGDWAQERLVERGKGGKDSCRPFLNQEPTTA